MSSFIVRKLSQHNLHSPPLIVPQSPANQLQITPSSVTLDPKQHQNKIIITKITLKNLANQKLEYTIQQPKQQHFKVRYNQSFIDDGGSVEIFLFFNTELFTGVLDDQIWIGGGANWKVSIPIAINKKQKVGKSLLKSGSKLKKQSLMKENVKIMKMKRNRVAREDRRKDGIFMQRQNESILLQKQLLTLPDKIFAFNAQFSKIELFLKDKSIKNEIYLGQQSLSKQKYFSILSFNLQVQTITKQQIQKQITSTYKTIKSTDGPSVRQFQNIHLLWNKNKNIGSITYRKGLEKVLRQVRGIVIYYRFRKMKKVLGVYRGLREQENAEQPQTKIVNNDNSNDFLLEDFSSNCSILQDSDRQHYEELEQRKKHDFYCRKITKIIASKKENSLGADFTQFTLSPRTLSMDFTQPQSKKNQIFQIKPRIGFDNWIALEESTVYVHEVMGYGKMQRIAPWQCHPRIDGKGENQMDGRMVDKKVQKEECFRIDCLTDTMMDRHNEIEQFTCSCLSETTKYKSYSYCDTQPSLSCSTNLQKSQIDIFKPPKISLQQLNELKCEKMQYFPYFQTSSPPMFQIVPSTPHLIPSVSKNEYIDFDQPSTLTSILVSNLQNNQHNIFREDYTNNSNTFSTHSLEYENDYIKEESGSEDAAQGKNLGEDGEGDLEDDIMYQAILGNLSSIVTRRGQTAHAKIGGWNMYSGSRDNYIYF